MIALNTYRFQISSEDTNYQASFLNVLLENFSDWLSNQNDHWKLWQVDKVWKIPKDGPQTLLECFRLGLKLAGPNGTICGTPSTDGKYQLKTYGDMEADSMIIGSALDYYGLIGARGRPFYSHIMLEIFVVLVTLPLTTLSTAYK